MGLTLEERYEELQKLTENLTQSERESLIGKMVCEWSDVAKAQYLKIKNQEQTIADNAKYLISLKEKLSEKKRKDDEEKAQLSKMQLKPYRSGDGRRRGGCKLTDKEIELLLMIYAKRGGYAHMSLNEAIRSVPLTHRTYYKVIRREYTSKATIDRINQLARKNDIELPK